MLYIVFDFCKEKELKSRKEYLKSAFNVDFKYYRLNGSTFVYETKCSYYDNIIFLVGHNLLINMFLKLNKIIRNKYIIIDSCYINNISEIEKFKVKKVFLSKNLNKEDVRFDDTGWNFGITKPEILLYDSRDEKDLIKRIKDIYYMYYDIRGKKIWEN